ncbi:uncharacterized protein ACIBXB_016715 isoform 2-T2 [Morphnus guianensis]
MDMVTPGSAISARLSRNTGVTPGEHQSCTAPGARVSVEMGEAAGPLSVSDSEDMPGGSLLIPSLETAEDLGDFEHLLCSIMETRVERCLWCTHHRLY